MTSTFCPVPLFPTDHDPPQPSPAGKATQCTRLFGRGHNPQIHRNATPRHLVSTHFEYNPPRRAQSIRLTGGLAWRIPANNLGLLPLQNSSRGGHVIEAAGRPGLVRTEGEHDELGAAAVRSDQDGAQPSDATSHMQRVVVARSLPPGCQCTFVSLLYSCTQQAEAHLEAFR